MPLFSIITVCRNAGKTLRAAMRSLQAQTITDYEWVVMDGASTDDTLEIASGFPADRLSLTSEPDRGIFHAMNKAARVARGEFLYFLNADDAFQDERVLEQTRAAIQADEGVEFLYGSVTVTDAGDRAVWQWEPSPPEDILAGLVSHGVPHQGCFAHRNLFTSKVGAFREDLPIASDYEWLVRLALRDDVRKRRLPFTVARFRTGGNSSDPAKTRQETNRVQDEHPELFERLGPAAIVRLFREESAALRRDLDTALAEREQLRERVETMRSKIESLKAKVEHNRQREASRRTAQERTADKGLRGWLRRLGR